MTAQKEKIDKARGLLDMFELEAADDSKNDNPRTKARMQDTMLKKQKALEDLETKHEAEIERLSRRDRWKENERQKYLPEIESFLREDCAGQVCNYNPQSLIGSNVQEGRWEND